MQDPLLGVLKIMRMNALIIFIRIITILEWIHKDRNPFKDRATQVGVCLTVHLGHILHRCGADGAALCMLENT